MKQVLFLKKINVFLLCFFKLSRPSLVTHADSNLVLNENTLLLHAFGLFLLFCFVVIHIQDLVSIINHSRYRTRMIKKDIAM